MQNHLIWFVLLLFHQTLAQAQPGAEQSGDLDHPGWKTGEKKTYKAYFHSNTLYAGDTLATFQSVYSIDVKVLAASDTGFLLQFHYYNTFLIEDGDTILSPYTQGEALRYVVRTNPQGRYQELANWDSLAAVLSAPYLAMFTEPKANENMLELAVYRIKKFQNQEAYTSEQLTEIKTFFLFFGKALLPGKPQTHQQLHPNFFSGDSLWHTTDYVVTSATNHRLLAQAHSFVPNASPTPDMHFKLRMILAGTEKEPPKDAKAMSQLVLDETIEAEISALSGWVLRTEGVQSMQTSGFKIVHTFGYTLQDP